MSEKLSEHFWRSEFACKGKDCCGGTAAIDKRVITFLEALRKKLSERVGKDTPITINSSFRCLTHNCKPVAKGGVGSTTGSQHTKGTAVDIACPTGISIDEFATMVEYTLTMCGFKGGIGKYRTFVHADVRGEWAYWDER